MSARALRKTLGFSTIELFGFLAYVFKDSLRDENRYNELRAVAYQPSLNDSQREAFSAQAARFKQEDLSQQMARDFLSAVIVEKAEAGKMNRRVYVIQYPNLIFHIFRSTVHRSIFSGNNDYWSLSRAVEDAYVQHPLPVTCQSLKADADLFRSIIDVCAEECAHRRKTFQKEAWEALWDCMEQSVQCLSYQGGDLFSVNNHFIHTLYLDEHGAPVLDKWIEQQLNSQSFRYYIPLWHRVINTFCNLERKADTRWSEAICTYRTFFEEFRTDSEDVMDHLRALCEQINWTQVPFLPPPEELSEIDRDIRYRARHGEAAGIRAGIKAMRKAPRSQKEVEQAAKDKEKVQMMFKSLSRN